MSDQVAAQPTGERGWTESFPSAGVLLAAREAAERMIDEGRRLTLEGQIALAEVVKAERDLRRRGVGPCELDPFEIEALRVASLETGIVDIPHWEAFRALCARVGATTRRRDAIYRLREIGLLDDNFDATPAGRDLLATVTR